ENAHTQVQRDVIGLQDRSESAQGPDTGALHQPDISGAARVWFCCRGAGLFWKAPIGVDAGGARDARRFAKGTVTFQSRRESPAGEVAPAVRSPSHARATAHH